MALVIGAICNDGVVIVGDRQDALLNPKIIGQDNNPIREISNVIFGIAAGHKAIVEIENFILKEIKPLSRGHRQKNMMEDIIARVTKKVKEANTHLSSDSEYPTEILMARQFPGMNNSKVHFIDRQGFMNDVNTYRILGSGSAYAFPFIERYYKPMISMEKFAELGLFSMKFVMDMYPKAGVDMKNGYASIAFIPHKGSEVTKPNEAELERLAKETVVRIERYREKYYTAIDSDFGGLTK